MTVATAPRVRKPAVLAGDWILYRHVDPAAPLPRCLLCPFPIADRSRVIMLPGQEGAPNQGPPLAHAGCVFDRRRRFRHQLHVL